MNVGVHRESGHAEGLRHHHGGGLVADSGQRLKRGEYRLVRVAPAPNAGVLDWLRSYVEAKTLMIGETVILPSTRPM